jgi:formylglycine-generating enzyme required for sulfatase activity
MARLTRVAACLALLAAPAAADCLRPAPPDPADPARGMVRVEGGVLRMGSDRHHPEERPVREVAVGAFRIDPTEVTNAQFAAFVAATGYVTRAERGLSVEEYPQIRADLRAPGSMVFAPPRDPVGLDDPARWWRYVRGASWRAPLGPGSSIEGFDHHPVVHVAVEDARAYARWAGRALPTEAEWEWAARGGLVGADHSWGEAFDPVAGWKANTWQGAFPARNTREDGWLTTAPAGCFAPNGYGLRDMAGNVWEYVEDDWAPAPGRVDAGRATVKGGSWLCAPNYCARYRPAARQPQERALGSNHIGFRTALRDE